VLAPPAALEAALAVTLLAPAPPLMFMGDEWGAREPFPFFCDFKGDLADAVRNGRRSEFAEAYARYKGEVPDPLSEKTVQLARLDWTAIEQPEHRRRLDLVRRLLAARKSSVIPRLPQLQQGPGHAEFANGVLTAQWTFASGETLSMLANLNEQSRVRPAAFNGKPVWGGAPPDELPPWSVCAAIGDP
jgi:1,4-alpha-glucan branching enzyme